MNRTLSSLSLLCLLTTTAHAGGLARPNAISARGIGLGGAFSAVADDPTALHFNPAGLAAITGIDIMLGAELVVAPRRYQPIYADDTTSSTGLLCNQDPPPDPLPARCLEQSPTAPPRPLPSLGFAARLSNEGVPSRLAFGVGVWNSFGGQLEYNDADPIPGTIIETRNAVIEVVPGLAYEVNDVLQIGAALRVGIGLFDTKAVARPNDAEMHATGVGAGFTLGAMVRPSERLSLGWYYRSALNVATKGSATVQLEPAQDFDLEFKQQWPQETGLGAAFRPMPKLLVAGQFDWHGWAAVEQVSPKFLGNADLTAQAAIPTDWENSWSLHAGAQYSVTPKIDVRGGFTYDTAAVTTQFQERQFIDSNKMLAALGGSVLVTRRIRVDTAFEILIPQGPVTIEDNSADFADFPELANASPGEHEGKLYTFELAVQLLY